MSHTSHASGNCFLFLIFFFSLLTIHSFGMTGKKFQINKSTLAAYSVPSETLPYWTVGSAKRGSPSDRPLSVRHFDSGHVKCGSSLLSLSRCQDRR